jgi:hypothetical protein
MSANRQASSAYAVQAVRSMRPNDGGFRALHVIAGLVVAFGGPTFKALRVCETLARAISLRGAFGSLNIRWTRFLQ